MINIVVEIAFILGTTDQIQITELSLDFLNVKNCVVIIRNAQDLSIVQLTTFVDFGRISIIFFTTLDVSL